MNQALEELAITAASPCGGTKKECQFQRGERSWRALVAGRGAEWRLRYVLRLEKSGSRFFLLRLPTTTGTKQADQTAPAINWWGYV